jgi:hypothetical protein
LSLNFRENSSNPKIAQIIIIINFQNTPISNAGPHKPISKPALKRLQTNICNLRQQRPEQGKHMPSSTLPGFQITK